MNVCTHLLIIRIRHLLTLYLLTILYWELLLGLSMLLLRIDPHFSAATILWWIVFSPILLLMCCILYLCYCMPSFFTQLAYSNAINKIMAEEFDELRLSAEVNEYDLIQIKQIAFTLNTYLHDLAKKLQKLSNPEISKYLMQNHYDANYIETRPHEHFLKEQSPIKSIHWEIDNITDFTFSFSEYALEKMFFIEAAGHGDYQSIEIELYREDKEIYYHVSREQHENCISNKAIRLQQVLVRQYHFHDRKKDKIRSRYV